MWAWHGKEYWGACHGVTGILYVLLQCEVVKNNENWMDAIQKTIDYLLLSFNTNPDGTFPSRKNGSTELCQWCHGPPGLLFLLCKAYEVFGKNEYLEGAERLSDVVWRTGLLVKGGGLCHGWSGNAYTFLCIYRTTGKKKYLHRAFQFAINFKNPDYSRYLGTPDRPFSLYEGISGMACLYMDLLRNEPKEGKFPCFEDIF